MILHIRLLKPIQKHDNEDSREDSFSYPGVRM